MLELIIECSKEELEENNIKSFVNIKYEFPFMNYYVVEVNEKDLPKLKVIKGVKSVHYNTHITAQMNNANKIIKSDIAHKKGYTGKNITIAILDTGIDPTNDFVLPKNRIIAFKDFINNKQEPYDDNGHGTHIA